MSQFCELCDRPLTEGYPGSVCAVCRQAHNDRAAGAASQYGAHAPQPAQHYPPPAPGAEQLQQHVHYHQPQQQQYGLPAYSSGKSRVAYVLLGLFLGTLGIHNFYAGYSSRAVTQLLLSVLLCWTVVVPIGVAIWVIVEICTVTVDSDGNPFS